MEGFSKKSAPMPARFKRFSLALPFIKAEISEDKAMQLQSLFDKFRRNEISPDEFKVHMMRTVGEQRLKVALLKMQEQERRETPSTVTATTPTQNPTCVMKVQNSSGKHSFDDHTIKTKEGEHLMDSHTTLARQTLGPSAIMMQGLSKQQQHVHFLKSSFPINGNDSTSVGPSSIVIKSIPDDSQENVRGAERNNPFDDPKRDLDATVANMPSGSMQHSFPTRQAIQNSRQKIGTLPIGRGRQLETQILSFEGPLISGAVQVEQGTVFPGSSNNELSKRQYSQITPSGFVSSHFTESLGAGFQVGPQRTMAGSMSRPSITQLSSCRKCHSHGALPPLPSKKQKVTEVVPSEGIELFNDVTVVSGVNLEAEREQLFSGSKDYDRASKPSHNDLQEEENKLVLQKIPLQKKLTEIMAKCGVKNMSNDAERCLALCVEKRLRGLISSIIRVSKQRTEYEKSRHHTVSGSDVREHVMALNRKAKQEWERKEAEAEKLQGHSTVQLSDDKIALTSNRAANLAVCTALGGKDILSKWQLMVKSCKHEGGLGTAPVSQAEKEVNNLSPQTSDANVKTLKEEEDQSAAHCATGVTENISRSQVTAPPDRAAHSTSVKDLIAVRRWQNPL